MAIKYDITITRAVNNIRNGTITEVPNTETVFEYEDLLPLQNYSICVIGYFDQQQALSSCKDFQTTSTPANSTLVGGIIGSTIALLVLLLIVAGVGLAYFRCIRSRVKSKGTSKVSKVACLASYT